MEITITAVVAVIIGLESILKNFGLKSKWIPVANLAFGVLGAFLYASMNSMPLAEIIFMGIIMGLTASGLYSGVKNVKEGIAGK